MKIDLAVKSALTPTEIPVAYVWKNGKPTSQLVVIDIAEDATGPNKLDVDGDYELKPYLYKNPKEVQSIRALIFGPQGSGKSYLAGEILVHLFENHQSKDIVIIARNTEDVPLDRKRICHNDFNERVNMEKTLKAVQSGKIKLGETITEFEHKKGSKYTPIRLDVYDPQVLDSHIESFKDSYLIFDDVERMKTKEATEFCHHLRDSALEVGRKLNICSVNILHNIKGGLKASVMRDESAFVFANPQASGQHKIRSFLRDYAALDKKEIEAFIKMKGRFVMVRTEFPRCFVGKSGVVLL
jgi:hypothetical protein